MLTGRRWLVWFIAIASLGTISRSARASEGGVGRPITGLQVTPYAGVVPPGPTFIVSVTPIVYLVRGGAKRTFPVAGRLAIDMDVTTSYNLVMGAFVWPGRSERWNFMSAVGMPIAYTSVTAGLSLGEERRDTTDSLTSQHDLLLVPVEAGYHFDDTGHMALGLSIYAPTGDYEVGRLANNGMNVWTFVPTLSGTKLFPKPNVELSATTAFELYTKNQDTDYESGVLYRLDVLAMKRFASGFGVGAVFGWIQQVTDDEGGVAAQLGGFKGRSLGVGPNLTYTRQLSDRTGLDLALRWVPEFAVKNRPQGHGLMLSVALAFQNAKQ